jgi:flagellin FlaB
VADNLNDITQVGDVSDRGDGSDNAIEDQIDRLRIGLQPASGADDINLAELTVQYVSDDEFANLVVGVDSSTGTSSDLSTYNQAEGDSDPSNIVISDSGNQGEYAVDIITAENENDIVMTDGKDRYELVIPLADDDDHTTGGSEGELPSTTFDSLVKNDGGTDVSDTGPLNPLDEGEELELTITTEVGSQTVAFLQVPDSLSGNDGGSTVSL